MNEKNGNAHQTNGKISDALAQIINKITERFFPNAPDEHSLTEKYGTTYLGSFSWFIYSTSIYIDKERVRSQLYTSAKLDLTKWVELVEVGLPPSSFSNFFYTLADPPLQIVLYIFIFIIIPPLICRSFTRGHLLTFFFLGLLIPFLTMRFLLFTSL